MTKHTSVPRSCDRFVRLACAAVFSLGLTFTLLAAETAKKAFDLPAGDAAATLKAFSDQSGEQIVYPVEQVRGVQTKAVKGELATREALNQMLADTGLTVVQDEKTGALAIRRDSAPNADSRPDNDQAAKMRKTESGAIKLATYTVLGSRIRQTETEGPSPVSSYDKEYIRSSGAMSLSDFLSQIPQTYSGIAFGRASTPNELNPEFGQRTETATPAFNFVLGSSAASPAQTGVSGVSLRGLGSGSTLVLVDGRRAAQSANGNRGTDTRQGFVDLNTIPLGMVDHIEVSTDGASAIYGADAVAGVINIILKKNYTGTEISGSFKTAEHGGGRERSGSVISGFSSGKLSGTVALEYYDRQNLKAADRNFSKDQNHSAITRGTLIATGTPSFGLDYRLNYGSPAVIQASGGLVAGTFDAIPGIRVVMVPTGSTGTPTVAQFIPVTTPAGTATIVNAAGQRRMNTAAYLDLIPQTKRLGMSGSLNYKFNDRLDAFASYRHSDAKSNTNAQLGANSITGGFGSAALLPAAFNPFNQNVNVAMVLVEWGSQSQRMRTLDHAATAGLRGRFAESWEWELGGSWQRQKVRQISRNFNPTPFANLMSAADPLQRFNPFIDPAAPGAPSQFALLDSLSLYPSIVGLSTAEGLDFSANGDLYEYWGGMIKMAFGGSVRRDEIDSTATNFSTALVPVATIIPVSGSQTTQAEFVEFQLPVFGKGNARPLLRRLDFNVAARHEDNSRFAKTVPKYGVSWTPVQSVLLRASWSEGFRAPSVTEYLTAPSVSTSTLTDPRRTPPSTPGIIESRGSNPDPQPELSENTYFGLVYEPAFIKGLNLQVNYYDTLQKDTLQLITAQNIVNNEALFPDRVTRAAATPADLALNQPGQILAVNRVFVNFGEVVNRSMDFVVDYRLPWQQYGNFHVNLAATRTLESTRALAPGQPLVILEEDTGSPPKWKFNAAIFWRKGDWSASTFVSYIDGFQSNNSGNALVANNTAVIFNPTPGITKVDVRVGYEFRKGLWREYGKGLRMNVGVNNVFDKEPPFSDTIWGFNAGIHSQFILGRSLELSFVLPL
jgi:outer membrane receptor protein involved in Fe transport